jgi:hypothetical protein
VSISREFAQLLGELGVGTFRPGDTGGDVFLSAMPPEPDAALVVARYDAGSESDAQHGYDEPRIQVRVRGPRGDADAAETRAQAVYDACHGLRRRDLPGGTPMLSCIGVQAGPIYLGPDDHGRHEWSVNFRCELRRITQNRT